MKRGLVWKTLGGVLLTGLVEWGLLAYPSTRLIGLVLLAVLLGFFLTFSLLSFTVGIAIAPLIERWGARGYVVAGVCLSVGILAMIGSIERAKPGFVWKYGEPTRVTIPREWSCTLSGNTCAGSWTSGGKTVQGGVTLSEDERDTIGSSMTADEDGAHHFQARALGDRAATAKLHIRPASSVALGKIPSWTGWGAGGVGLAAVLFAIVAPRNSSRAPTS